MKFVVVILVLACIGKLSSAQIAIGQRARGETSQINRFQQQLQPTSDSFNRAGNNVVGQNYFNTFQNQRSVVQNSPT
jgi:hypothetical protein